MIEVPTAIIEEQRWNKKDAQAYMETANRGMDSKDPWITECVRQIRNLTNGAGYGALPGQYYGDYSSYEYCQWMKEKELKTK